MSLTATREPFASRVVTGAGGVGLSVREWGDPTGPGVLFVHGWSQSQLCWARQLESPVLDRHRLVTFDIRGHGMSEKPRRPAEYTEARIWADDLAAVIEQADLRRPVVVAWSYGGFVVADYLRAYGDGELAGIVLVGGAVRLTPPTYDHIGPGLLANAEPACSPDLDTSIPAMRQFLRACTAEPLNDDDWSAALAWNMVVPPEVRGALLSRAIDGDDVLASLSIPVLVAHGRADAIVLPSMAEHVLAVCPTAAASWYDGVGHMPFWEEVQRFNQELADFIARVS